MQTIIWIIVAVVLLALIAGAIAYVARRKRREALTVKATELRSHAARRETEVAEEKRRAEAAEAEARLARVRAERAEQHASQVRQAAAYTEAEQEDTLREADRIDPSVSQTRDGTPVRDGEPIGEEGYTARAKHRQDI